MHIYTCRRSSSQGLCRPRVARTRVARVFPFPVRKVSRAYVWVCTETCGTRWGEIFEAWPRARGYTAVKNTSPPSPSATYVVGILHAPGVYGNRAEFFLPLRGGFDIVRERKDRRIVIKSVTLRGLICDWIGFYTNLQCNNSLDYI